VNEVFGRGLTAQSFAGYKGQRYRWAYGAVQILKRYWRELLPWADSRLSQGQRYHFLTGWAPWFADGLQLLFTIAALFWTVGLLASPRNFEFPVAAFLVPTIGMFGFKMLHSLWLYTAHVQSTWRQRLGAAVAATALTHGIARAMLKGLYTSSAPFFRTPKAEDKPAVVRAVLAAREECLLLVGLWIGVIGVATRYGIGYIETQLWVAVLLVQSVPYMAALWLSLLNTRPAVVVARQPQTQPLPAPAAGLPAEAMDTPDRQVA